MDHKSPGLVIGLISSNWLYLIYYRCISIDYHPSRGRISALYPLTQIKDWLSETLKKNVSFLSGSGHEMKVMLKCTIMNGCFCRAAVKLDFMLWAGTFQSAAETRRCYSHRWWIPTPCWRPSPARRAVSLHYCYIDPRYYNIRARKKHLILFFWCCGFDSQSRWKSWMCEVYKWVWSVMMGRPIWWAAGEIKRVVSCIIH